MFSVSSALRHFSVLGTAFVLANLPVSAQEAHSALGSLPNDFPTANALENNAVIQPLTPDTAGTLTTSDPSLGTSAVAAIPSPTFSDPVLSQPTTIGGRDRLTRRERPKSRFELGIRGGVEYNDNIFAEGSDEEEDVLVIVAPTLAVNAGDFRRREGVYLSAAYTATGSTFINNTTDETLDHLLAVEGQLKQKRLTVPFQARLARETGSFLDVNGRDTAQSAGIGIGLDYAINQKLSLGITGEYSMTDYDLFADFESFTTDVYVTRKLSQKAAWSAIYRYNSAEADGADPQKFQAALARVTLDPNSKWTGFAEAGVAFSDLDNGDRTDLIYRLGLAYRPTSKQRFTVEASRRPSTSSFTVGSGFIENGVLVSYERAIGAKARWVVSGGYQVQDYFAADEGVTVDRQEDTFQFSTALAYDLNAHWRAELYYSYVSNDSNEAGLGFDNQRFGLGLNWSY